MTKTYLVMKTAAGIKAPYAGTEYISLLRAIWIVWMQGGARSFEHAWANNGVLGSLRFRTYGGSDELTFVFDEETTRNELLQTIYVMMQEERYLHQVGERCVTGNMSLPYRHCHERHGLRSARARHAITAILHIHDPRDERYVVAMNDGDFLALAELFQERGCGQFRNLAEEFGISVAA